MGRICAGLVHGATTHHGVVKCAPHLPSCTYQQAANRLHEFLFCPDSSNLTSVKDRASPWSTATGTQRHRAQC